MSAPQTTLTNLKTSVDTSIKQASDYLDNLKKQIADHDAQFNHNATDFFQASLANATHALEDLKASAQALPSHVEAANKQHLDDVQASLATLSQHFDQLKVQASDYDAKFNAKVADFFNQQRQHIDAALHEAKEHVDALVHHV
ncbi:Aste57867_22571 [Aphanomyces stellatus]|uniref:Aste57867_22571 protein n=1 Tax=Aphanomyces stellatus TaxID=120398 RepID=A0A485LQB1_9STRA|nr:hypothetical protein As57867_022501 [Aphanomyces stellatus]VFT99229.1 Aste57867_22571 [Aphanomyces stellatus]